jgi:hypothetical protein
MDSSKEDCKSRSRENCEELQCYSKIIFIEGRKGHRGLEGPSGGRADRVGNLSYSLITPTDNNTIIPLNPNDDIIEINTSNFSPTVTLGIPTAGKTNCNCSDISCRTHYIEIRLLFQRGLPAEIQLISGGTFEISAANPNVLLFWDCNRWNVMENPADISSVMPNAAKPNPIVTPSDGILPNLGFSGQDVALSADGTTLAVGGSGDNGGIGATWIFIRTSTSSTISSTGSWVQQGLKLIGSGAIGLAHQGTSVSLSADGNTLAVGGPYDNSSVGATWIFIRTFTPGNPSEGIWTQQGPKLVGTGAIGTSQGLSVTLSADGNTLAVGSPNDNGFTGATWIFIRSGGAWFQQGPKLVASDSVGAANQGFSTALSADGNTLVVGGPNDNTGIGAIWIYVRDVNGVWSQQGPKLIGAFGSSQGTSVAISSDGNTVAEGGIENFGGGEGGTPGTGINGQGAFWVFIRGNGTITGLSWTQQAGPIQPIQPPNTPITTDPLFAISLALSADGNTLAVGAPGDRNNTGAAWIFHRVNTLWTQFGFRLAVTPSFPGDGYGISVDLSSDGNIMALAGYGVNSFAGAVAIFQ